MLEHRLRVFERPLTTYQGTSSLLKFIVNELLIASVSYPDKKAVALAFERAVDPGILRQQTPENYYPEH